MNWVLNYQGTKLHLLSNHARSQSVDGTARSVCGLATIDLMHITNYRWRYDNHYDGGHIKRCKRCVALEWQ